MPPGRVFQGARSVERKGKKIQSRKIRRKESAVEVPAL
jgi:hypothetical protein